MGNVSFGLQPGGTFPLVGESDYRKSTIGRALPRLIESQRGEVIFNGQRIDTLAVSKLQSLRRDVQFIFQDPYASLDPHQIMGYFILEPLRVHGLLQGSAGSKRVTWLLERVGLLPEHAWRYSHKLSGSQCQRICTVWALALSPKVIIADGSVSTLDVPIRGQIINLMPDLQRELSITYLFISHDMTVVGRINHRVVIIYLGQIVEIDARRAMFEDPQHPYTRKLMTAAPVADPSHHHPQHVLLSNDIPGDIRRRGGETPPVPLQLVDPRHYVTRPLPRNVLSCL